MAKFLKKQGFLPPVERLFTDEYLDAYDLIRFRTPEEQGDESWPALECPENWSAEAAAVLAEEAACPSIPEQTKLVEENTTPSWLWQRKGAGRGQTKETSARQIFNRVAGAAAYAGWKKGVFAGERDARAFYDETRYLLAQRFIALEPRHLATIGLDWAYGIAPPAPAQGMAAAVLSFEAEGPGRDTHGIVDIRNASIDAIISGNDAETGRKWQRLLAAGLKNRSMTLRFADIANDWGGAAEPAPRAALDLLAFRRGHGPIDIDALCHAVRLSVILLDLLDNRDALAIGFCNLAPLLTALVLPYDSEAGRATAGALAAIVTAEAYAASAHLAGLLGVGSGYTANCEAILRTLRNRRRAAYGDCNDYEKISVLPVPLTLNAGADLSLIAAARRCWDEALDLVRQHGLRHGQVTSLFTSPTLAFFLESAAQGIEPMPSLIVSRATESGTYRRDIHPAVPEALTKLGYDPAERKAVVDHIAGAGTLENAPGIDCAGLRARGFDDEALERLENYLPYVNDIRIAFTPWVLGEEFCLKSLKVPAGKLDDPHFDLLRHLGFSAVQVAAANGYCFGHGSAAGAGTLRPEHAAIFAQSGEIAAEARIRMAATVQGFVSGGADLHVTLPAHATAEESGKLLLAAWRQGVKSISIHYEPAGAARTGMKPALPDTARLAFARKTPLPHAKEPGHLPVRKSRPRAQGKLVSLKGKTKPAGAPDKNKRH